MEITPESFSRWPIRVLKYLEDLAQTARGYATFQWSPNSSSASWGQVAGNASTPKSVTELVFNVQSRSQNLDGLLQQLKIGDGIRGMGPGATGSQILYTITGVSYPAPNQVKVEVTVEDSAGDPVGGWTDVNVLFIVR